LYKYYIAYVHDPFLLVPFLFKTTALSLPTSYEKELLRQIAEGSETAFKTLFEKYRNKLYHYLHHITKSREVAEEIVMDVFLKLWLGREMVREIDQFDAFLFRVAQNKAIDFLRSVNRDHTLRHHVWEEMQAAAERADSRVICTDIETTIRQAVRHLSPQRQLVYQLSREDNLTHDQIASRLNLSRNTIKNHIVESVRFIRGYLHNHEEMMIIVISTLFFLRN
jgi:RNA polymerase sigma-70 factor (ECF subfamily)